MSQLAYVIGGAGFIGGRLVEALVACGGRVIVLDPAVPIAPGQAVTYVRGAITRDVLEELRRAHGAPAQVYHLAGSGSVGGAELDPDGDRMRTVDSTETLLAHLRDSPAGRLIYVSSAAVYGDRGATPLTEDLPRRPISVYGRNKARAEELVEGARHRGEVDGSIVRFFSVYGPGLRKQLLWDACGRLQRGDAMFGGTGDELRDWLHVEDAVALLQTVASATRAVTVNGGSGIGASVRLVIERLARALGVTQPISFTGTARAGDPQCLIAEVTQVNRLGWKAHHDLRLGLDEYARWFEAAAC